MISASASGGSAPTVAEQPAHPAKKADLKVRVISGGVYGALFIGALWAGGWVLGGFLAVLWLLAVWEWARLTCGVRPVRSAALIILAGVLALPIGALPAWFWAVPLVASVTAVALGGRWPWLRWTGLGMAYLGLPAAVVPWLFVAGARLGSTAAVLTGLVIVVWATDVAAYFVGRAVGGPKLAPRISPGKTWSGSIGGAVGAALVAGVATLLVELLPVGVVIVTAVAVWVSAWSQVGDLFESWVKRRFGVKDSGKLIPGHGGVLDRIDGLLFGVLAMVPVMLVLL